VSRPPVTILGAAAVQAVIALAVIGSGGVGLVSLFRGEATSIGTALPLALFTLAIGAVLGYVAWGLVQVNNWARSPVVITQIFLVLIALYLWNTGAPAAVALACGAAGATGLVLVLAPQSTEALYPHPDNS
jgi:hypothetical protein